ncbi:MAG: NifB/NifX family molybdenum-iron cluster-binding protein, partial [Desulfosalsimonas sp.]
LAENNVDVVLAGGMGHRAIELLSQAGILVVTGSPVKDPEALVTGYINNSLETGENACSGGADHQCRGH